MQSLEKRVEALEQKLSLPESMLIVRVIVTPFDLGREWHTAAAVGFERRWTREEGEAADEFRQRVFNDAEEEGVRALTVNGTVDPENPWTP